jgi:propionate CoA-transferase
VLVVTERCVFEVRATGLTLLEVAPGIDVARDIAPFLDFELPLADSLRTMPDDLYKPGPMGMTLRPATQGAGEC